MWCHLALHRAHWPSMHAGTQLFGTREMATLRVQGLLPQVTSSVIPIWGKLLLGTMSNAGRRNLQSISARSSGRNRRLAYVDDQCTHRRAVNKKNNFTPFFIARWVSSSSAKFFYIFSSFATWTLAKGSTVGVEVMPVLTSGSVARFRDQVWAPRCCFLSFFPHNPRH